MSRKEERGGEEKGEGGGGGGERGEGGERRERSKVFGRWIPSDDFLLRDFTFHRDQDL